MRIMAAVVATKVKGCYKSSLVLLHVIIVARRALTVASRRVVIGPNAYVCTHLTFI